MILQVCWQDDKQTTSKMLVTWWSSDRSDDLCVDTSKCVVVQQWCPQTATISDYYPLLYCCS